MSILNLILTLLFCVAYPAHLEAHIWKIEKFVNGSQVIYLFFDYFHSLNKKML